MKARKAVHNFIGEHFGSDAGPGSAAPYTYMGIEYTGCQPLDGPTPAGNLKGHFATFRIPRQGEMHRLDMRAHTNRKGEYYLVFRLDNAPTPTFEYHLDRGKIHRVSGGFWMTHLKHIGLGGGGAIGHTTLLDALNRELPTARTAGVVDLGGLLTNQSHPLIGVAGFLHRVLEFCLLRQRLRNE